LYDWKWLSHFCSVWQHSSRRFFIYAFELATGRLVFGDLISAHVYLSFLWLLFAKYLLLGQTFWMVDF